MKYLFSFMITILLALSATAFAPTDSMEIAQPQTSGLVISSEKSIPSETKRTVKEFADSMSKQATASALSGSTRAIDTTEDSTLVVRVVESPAIDTRLTFCAVIISAIAVLFSAISLIVSVALQIKHNCDEVRPIVAIRLDLVTMSIKIKNHGVGPAVFKRMKWTNVRSNISSNTLAGLLSEEWSNLNLSPFYIYTKPFEGTSNDPDVLAPQEELFFIGGDGTGFPPMTLDQKKALGETFRDIELQLTYTDLYGKREWTLEKNLSWMADWS